MFGVRVESCHLYLNSFLHISREYPYSIRFHSLTRHLRRKFPWKPSDIPVFSLLTWSRIIWSNHRLLQIFLVENLKISLENSRLDRESSLTHQIASIYWSAHPTPSNTSDATPLLRLFGFTEEFFPCCSGWLSHTRSAPEKKTYSFWLYCVSAAEFQQN